MLACIHIIHVKLYLMIFFLFQECLKIVGNSEKSQLLPHLSSTSSTAEVYAENSTGSKFTYKNPDLQISNKTKTDSKILTDIQNIQVCSITEFFKKFMYCKKNIALIFLLNNQGSVQGENWVRLRTFHKIQNQ